MIKAVRWPSEDVSGLRHFMKCCLTADVCGCHCLWNCRWRKIVFVGLLFLSFVLLYYIAYAFSLARICEGC